MHTLLANRKENIFDPKQLLNLPCVHCKVNIVTTCKFYYSRKSRWMENMKTYICIIRFHALPSSLSLFLVTSKILAVIRIIRIYELYRDAK